MEATWEDKSPHGAHHHQIEEVANIRKSYRWLENVAMTDSRGAGEGGEGCGEILGTEEQD